MQRLLAVLLVLLGLTGLALGRLGETTWAPATETTATVDLSDAGPAVVIDPGVLYVGGEEGEVVIEGASDVTVITAANGDIEAYLEGVHHTRVTGASDWSTLSTEDVNPDGENELKDPASSDLWRTVETAPSPYTLDVAEFWAGENGENEQVYRAILIVTDGTEQGADSVSITWPNDAVNEWVPFAYAGGATVAVIGLVLLVVTLGGRRRDEDDAELAEDDHAPASALAAAPAAGVSVAGADAAQDADGDAEAEPAGDAVPAGASTADADGATDDTGNTDATDGATDDVDAAAAAEPSDSVAPDRSSDMDLLFGAPDQGPREENVWALGGTHSAADSDAVDPESGTAESGTAESGTADSDAADSTAVDSDAEDRTEQIDAIGDEEGRR